MKLLKVITKACDDLKAIDIKILDMRGISVLLDYMVICTGNSERQVSAIVKKVKDEIGNNNFKIKHIEGDDYNQWVLIDCYDVVCHVFQSDDRIKYSLEKVWGDVPIISLEELLD